MHGKGGRLALQSAMEYLMTYGWAVLIIAVALLAIFQLGLFNASTYTPVQQPGSCWVYRPYGPWSTQLMALAGVCNSGLPKFFLKGSGFTSNVLISTLPRMNQFTFVGWISNNHPQAGKSGGGLISQSTCGVYLPGVATTYTAEFDPCSCKYANNGANTGCAAYGAISGLKYKQWYMIAITVDLNANEKTYAYTGTANILTATSTTVGVPIYVPSGPTTLGSYDTLFRYPLNGSIANMQIYNTSLTDNEIQTLYLEGIGGAPVVLQSLVGWWPLNQNANDYSGNNVTAAAYNTVYSSFLENYTTP